MASDTPPGPPPADDPAEAKAAVRETVRRGEARDVSRREQLENDRLAQDLRLRSSAFRSELVLRERYAKWLLVLMAAQVVLADVIFVAYAWLGRGWDVPSEVVTAWLGATVLQVVGVVAVVTRHLFPSRTGHPFDS